jgi:hypothetical protein
VRTTLVAFIVVSGLAACAGGRDFVPPQTIPYQNGAPAFTSAGDNYVAIDGGACLGRCPQFEIYVFDTGKVIFRGSRTTAERGSVESQVARGEYLTLKRLLENKRAFAHRFHFPCKTDHPAFNIIATEGPRIRVANLNYGCSGDAKVLEKIEDAFIRVSNSRHLIGS